MLLWHRRNQWDTYLLIKVYVVIHQKIQAIINMPDPQNASELHRFLGMLVYLGNFIPNLSSKTSELRKLLEADVDWNWTQ